MSKKQYTAVVKRPSEVPSVDKYVKKLVDDRAKIAEVDAELNGALVEIANILGTSVYMRVDHRDPEKAAHDLAKMRSIIKDMVYPED